MNNYKCNSVGIIGAGIQGVCIGLQLTKKGVPVTIFDRATRERSSVKETPGRRISTPGTSLLAFLGEEGVKRSLTIHRWYGYLLRV